MAVRVFRIAGAVLLGTCVASLLFVRYAHESFDRGVRYE